MQKKRRTASKANCYKNNHAIPFKDLFYTAESTLTQIYVYGGNGNKETKSLEFAIILFLHFDEYEHRNFMLTLTGSISILHQVTKKYLAEKVMKRTIFSFISS